MQAMNQPKIGSFTIVSPIDGDMMHPADGIIRNGRLEVKMLVTAAPGSRLLLNGEPMQGDAGSFTGLAALTAYKNKVTVEDAATGETQTIELYRLDHFEGRYRLSIDDNIWFLRDLQQQADKYHSLFENPFMGFLKELHDQYGTKIHLNVFYQTDSFDLSMMPDKYKAEWIASAGWLRLSFHAWQEFPDKPYINAGYETVERDCAIVMKEVKRFAGIELTGPVTTIHWGEATKEGSRALRDAGYKGQLGYFNVDDDLPSVNYYLDVEQTRQVKKRFVWKDTRQDVVFIRTSLVIDTKKLDEILPHLEAYKENGGKPPYLDLLVHEQYFYPFYFNYQPDYREKIKTAVQWAAGNGYEPAFLEECIFSMNQNTAREL